MNKERVEIADAVWIDNQIYIEFADELAATFTAQFLYQQARLSSTGKASSLLEVVRLKHEATQKNGTSD